MKSWLRTAIALVIGFTAASTAAQQATTVTPAAAAPAQKGSGGVQDGIKLHGNWVLEVRKPDGTVVERRAFKNALTENGKSKLGRMMIATHPFYAITVTFNQNFGPYDPVPTYAPTPICDGLLLCRAFEINGPYEGGTSFDFTTMTRTTTASGTLILNGWIMVTAPGGGRIERIATLIHERHALIVGDTQPFLFTLATLPTPLFVPEGQIVQFTYTLSLS